MVFEEVCSMICSIENIEDISSKEDSNTGCELKGETHLRNIVAIIIIGIMLYIIVSETFSLWENDILSKKC